MGTRVYRFAVGLALATVSVPDSGRAGTVWTWMSGTNVVDQTGAYGTRGVAAPTNVPGARYAPVSWCDGHGALWLFGGTTPGGEFLNDLWRFRPSARTWTWFSGARVPGEVGVYGQRGVPTPLNVPGARQGSVSWVDVRGALWLFGGTPDYFDFFNDLWRFDGTNWAWISGENAVNDPGSHGVRGLGHKANRPGARMSSVSWIDPSGRLWLFGGSAVQGWMNDLWRFDGTNWTWQSGDDASLRSGNYGHKNVASEDNAPGARNTAFSWTDEDGRLWLFGGRGLGSTVADEGNLNDLWCYWPADRTWTWVSGTNVAGQAGIYGQKGAGHAANVPGARSGGASWTGADGVQWLFGGSGIDAFGASDLLNDLWRIGSNAPLAQLTIDGDPAPRSVAAPLDYGVHLLPIGSVVTNAVATPTAVLYGSRVSCVGWRGSGSVPAAGSTSEVSFVLSTDSTLVWRWTNEYELAVSARPGGTVNAAQVSGWYGHGAVVHGIEATASAHYRFLGWTGVEPGHESANPLTVTMDSPRNIEAWFEAKTHRLTIDSDYGMATPMPPVYDGLKDTAVTCSVAGSPHEWGGARHTCTGWTLAGSEPASGSGTNFVLTLTNDCHLTWLWETEYRLNSWVLGNGSVDVPTSWFDAGSNVTVTATPAAHWHFAGWDGDTNDCPMAGNRITLPMTRERWLVAAFVIDTHVLTVASAHGSAWPEPGVHTNVYGSPLWCGVLDPTETAGGTQYLCTGWTLRGSEPAAGAGANFTLTVTNDCQLTWHWRTNYWLDTHVIGDGLVSVSDAWKPRGSDVLITAIPSPQWRFERWQGDTNGCLLSGVSCTVPVTRPRFITAVFEKAPGATNVVDLTIEGDPAPHGWPVPHGYGVHSLASNTVVANSVASPVDLWAGSRAVCLGWRGAGSVSAAGSGTAVLFTLLRNSTLTWRWTNEYQLVVSADTGGRVNAVAVDGWYRDGAVVQGIAATADPDCRFIGWTGDVPPANALDNPLALAMDGPRYVTAQFAAVVPPMVLVSGGTFSMGLQGGSAGRDVTVGDFYLDTREVTVGDYRAFCTASGRPMPPAPPWGWADTNLPVVNVSWTDADAFAAWAGKRLPTEAEYEYAMRAGNFGAAYPWGDAIDPSLANYGLNVGRPTAAGTYPITGAGVLDIAGNVWEWCADWYRSMLTGPVTNPVGPAFGTHRVIRGGSWANPPERLRCAPRYALEPDVRWVDVGFRCARTAKGGTDPTLTGGPWFGAYDLGEGWRHLAWFGVFWDAESGWIWHPSHGWIWATAAHPRSVWLWTTDLGWLWSGSTFYPWLWRASDRTWIYYYRDTDPRAFWNSATGQVEWR